jgi:hypothetical protein
MALNIFLFPVEVLRGYKRPEGFYTIPAVGQTRLQRPRINSHLKELTSIDGEVVKCMSLKAMCTLFKAAYKTVYELYYAGILPPPYMLYVNDLGREYPVYCSSQVLAMHNFLVHMHRSGTLYVCPERHKRLIEIMHRRATAKIVSIKQ